MKVLIAASMFLVLSACTVTRELDDEYCKVTCKDCRELSVSCSGEVGEVEGIVDDLPIVPSY